MLQVVLQRRFAELRFEFVELVVLALLAAVMTAGRNGAAFPHVSR